jgi:hypothetical protein
MVSRAARILSLPACVTVLTGLCFEPPQWAVAPAARPVSQAQAVAPAPRAPVVKKPLPRLVAVDRRIARRVNDLRPCVRQRLLRVVQKLPKNVTLLVTSAHRTRAEQAALRGTFGIKARPGSSTHEDGRAVDLNVFVNGSRIRPRRQQKVIGAVMASEGFRHLGPRDPVHYSVPKEAIDKLAAAPELEVPTMRELVVLKEELAEARQQADAAAHSHESAIASAGDPVTTTP